MRIHHIGYLVKNIHPAIEEFKKLGYSLEEPLYPQASSNTKGIVFDEKRLINIAFLLNNTIRIELVQPVDKASPVYNLLKKYKNCPYHICYYSSNLEGDIKKLGKNGWTLFQAPEKAPAINNKLVAFLINSSVGMIELVEIA